MLTEHISSSPKEPSTMHWTSESRSDATSGSTSLPTSPTMDDQHQAAKLFLSPQINVRTHKRSSSDSQRMRRVQAVQYLTRQYEVMKWIELVLKRKIMKDPFDKPSDEIEPSNTGKSSTDHIFPMMSTSPPSTRAENGRQSTVIYNNEYVASPKRRSNSDNAVMIKEIGSETPQEPPQPQRTGSLGKLEMEKWQKALTRSDSSKRLATSSVEEKRKLETLGIVAQASLRRSKSVWAKRTGQSMLAKSATLRESSQLLVKEGVMWSIQPNLKDGVILCELVRALNTKLIPYIHVYSKQAFKHKENICYFLEAAAELGVASNKLFQISQLYDNLNFFRVLECLEELAFVIADTMSIPGLTSGEVPQWPEEYLVAAERQLIGVLYRPRESARESCVTRARAHSVIRRSIVEQSASVQVTEAVKTRYLIAPKREKIMTKVIKCQSIVRGYLARRAFRKRVTDEAHRKHVIREILETERTYVKSLNTLIKVFYDPLYTALKLKQPIVSEEQIKLMFSDTIRVILNYNNRLLTELEDRVSNWHNSQKVGDIFLPFTNFLKVYTQYVKDFAVAQETFDKIKSKTKFAKFLDICRHNPETRSNELPQFLILPVQRIPRYILLLNDLVKHTWPEHVDYEDLKKALSAMENVAAYINDRKKDADSINRIAELEKKFTNKKEVLQSPSRRFIREDAFGLLHEGKRKERFVYLFNDKVVVTRKSSRLNNKQKVLISFNLIKLEIRDTEKTYPYPGTFALIEEDGIVLVFVAPNYLVKEEWMAEFTKAKEESIKSFKFQIDVGYKLSVEKAAKAKKLLEEKFKNLDKRPRKRPVAAIRYQPRVIKVLLQETETPSETRSRSLSRRATVMIQDEVECPPHLMTAFDRQSFLSTSKEVNPNFFRSFYLSKRKSYIDVMNSASSASSTDD